MATAKATTNAKSETKAPKVPTKEPKQPKEKKVKVTKVTYPGLINADGEAVALTEWPADFDSKLHKPLKRTQFKCESTWYSYQADVYEEKAKAYRQEAEAAKKLGGSKEAAKAKKLIKMHQQSAALRAQLAAAGIDVDAMLAASATEE